MATPLTYRQWLQMKANDRSGEVPTDVTYSKMLLDIVGDDGKLDANAVGSNRKFIGDDGETYYTAGAEGDFADPSKGLMDVNKTLYARYNNYVNNPTLVSQFNQESEGYAGGGSFSGGSSGQTDPDAALRERLRKEILGKSATIEDVYKTLFGDLDKLVASRRGELETQYGDQLSRIAEQYAGAIPEIQNSYAAIGAFDSTDTADAKDKAKAGFDDTTKQIGQNKKDDLSKLGAYRREQRATFSEDRNNARRELGRVNETEDVSALRNMRNSLENNVSTARVTQSKLGTDGAARKDLLKLTGDAGRSEQAINALDSILKSSMSGSVKQAAVEAVGNAAGLSDEEKQRIHQQYGNVYAEQAAL